MAFVHARETYQRIIKDYEHHSHPCHEDEGEDEIEKRKEQSMVDPARNAVAGKQKRHDKKAAQDDGDGNAPEIFRAGMSDNVLIGAEKERGRQAACARTDQNEGKRDEAEFRRSEPQQYEAHRKSGKQRDEQIAEENDPAIHISSLEESD